MTHAGITFRDIVRICIVSVLVLLVIVYILFQARFLITGPQVVLRQELPMKQNERLITLRGETNNISRLWLNGRLIFTDPQGSFAAAVVLENGYTVTTLEAEDRYGRRTALTREFVYAPLTFIP